MRTRINEAAPEVVSRHNNLTLYKVDSPEIAAKTVWFNGNASIAAQYVPVWVVTKGNKPYVAVHFKTQTAQDTTDKAITPEIAQEIAPLFAPLRNEFGAAPGRQGNPGFAALQQAVLATEDEGEPELGDEGGVAVEEPPEGVPPSRLKMGMPKAAPQKGVDPLAGMRQMTSQDVDAAIERANVEKDPAVRRNLQRQALSMMAQESKKRGESRAQCWVRHLLD